MAGGKPQTQTQAAASRDVARLQLLLNLIDGGKKIGTTGRENGRWDSQTQAAVSTFVDRYNDKNPFPNSPLSPTSQSLPQLLHAVEKEVRDQIEGRVNTLGDNRSKITGLQTKMAYLGHYLGPIDGQYTGDAKKELDTAITQFNKSTFSTRSAITFDPGHGDFIKDGKVVSDPGALGANKTSNENVVVLEIAHAAKAKLTASPKDGGYGYHPSQIQLTRDTGTVLASQFDARTLVKGTSWVSIHADEAETSRPTGGHVVVSQNAGFQGQQLAANVSGSMSKTFGNPIRERELNVLTAPIAGSPARILAEVDFLSNPDVQKALSNPVIRQAWIDSKAAELAKGIDGFERSQGRGPSREAVFIRRAQSVDSTAAAPPNPAQIEATRFQISELQNKYGSDLKLLTPKTADNDSGLQKQVQQLQKNLNQLGFKLGREDGLPGDKTKEAIAGFIDAHPKPSEAAAAAAAPATETAPALVAPPAAPAEATPAPAPTEQPTAPAPLQPKPEPEPVPQAPKHYIPPATSKNGIYI